MVERTNDGTLKQTPDSLNAVGVNVAAHPFLGAVVHLLMLGVFVREVAVALPLVGVDGFYVVGNMLLNEGMESLAIRVLDLLKSNAASALHHSDNDGLVAPVAMAETLCLATNPSLIDLYDAVQWVWVVLSHGRTDAVAQIPRGLVAHSDGALNLVCADALLALKHEVDGEQPFPKRNLGVVEDGVYGHAELVAALVTVELVTLTDG